MAERCYYAVYNSYADLKKGQRGHSHTWEIRRFKTRPEREAFVKAASNWLGRAVTRREAVDIWQGNYSSVGEKCPGRRAFDDAVSEAEATLERFENIT